MSRSTASTPLADLIARRSEALGVSEAELLERLGYRNRSKGLGRLRAFREARGLEGIAHLRKPLAEALDVPVAEVDDAIERTRGIARARADAAYAATFRPHAILKTEREIPSQITLAAICRADRWRRIDFEDGSNPITYVAQVLAQCPDGLPFFGRVEGFWINYSPERAVEYGRDGNPVAARAAAARTGQAVMPRWKSTPVASVDWLNEKTHEPANSSQAHPQATRRDDTAGMRPGRLPRQTSVHLPGPGGSRTLEPLTNSGETGGKELEKKRRTFPLNDPEKVFFLECEGDERAGFQVWFVNGSDEQLDQVKPDSLLLTGVDDELIISEPADDSSAYHDVKPGEAVLIDFFHPMYDGDFINIWGVELKSAQMGTQRFREFGRRFKPPNITFLWRPLPEEMKDPDDPSEMVDPVKVARQYQATSGNDLKGTVRITKGDLMYRTATRRLRTAGITLKEYPHRGGSITEFHFLDGDGQLIFRSVDMDRTIKFLAALHEPE